MWHHLASASEPLRACVPLCQVFILCSPFWKVCPHQLAYFNACRRSSKSKVFFFFLVIWQRRQLWLREVKELDQSHTYWGEVVRILEKAMAPHSSTLAWKIPWMEEPGRLQSRGSLRVGHDWATSLSLLTFMHWRRKWQPTPVFLPGESQGRGSLVGCRLWGRTELDMTKVT